MQIYPSNYEQLELTVGEKSFLRRVEQTFLDTEMAYYVLHINPRRKIVDNGKQPELFNLLLINKGILLFRYLEATDSAAQIFIKTLCKSLGSSTVYNVITRDIFNRLEESRYLTDESGKLRFSLNICFVFPEINIKQAFIGLDNKERTFCSKHVLFKDTVLEIRSKGAVVFEQYLQGGDELNEDFINNVFQRLCPEITIPRKYILDEYSKVSGTDGTLDDTDRSVQSYRLDNKQIDIVNKISKGNQLILACAGSGKSVLLISKCFKLASLNPNENFLITCYNRNLNDYYQWAIAQAGFKNRNVQCSTFFGLCKKFCWRTINCLFLLYTKANTETKMMILKGYLKLQTMP